MQPVEVVARFDKQGQVTPIRMVWRNHTHAIESTGRRWQAADGLHILVTTAEGRMFELRFDLPAGVWYLVQAGPVRMAL